MKTTTEYEQLLTVILEDLRVCLRYTPNRENDLLCFMEQYLKSAQESRPLILEEIRDCMPSQHYVDTIAEGYQSAGFELDILVDAIKETAQRIVEEPELEQQNLFGFDCMKWW